jgi:hypothetical protein
MSEQIMETHRCKCGEGNIYVKKVVVTGMGSNQSQPMEGIASIAPCRVCGSTENSNGFELDKKKR